MLGLPVLAPTSPVMTLEPPAGNGAPNGAGEQGCITVLH